MFHLIWSFLTNHHNEEGLGKKYVNDLELWQKTEHSVREALIEGEFNFVEVPGEAAFYGPKIDVQVWSAIGREFTLATNQVDFAVPGKFDLTFTNSKGNDETPLCIHRAPLGTHERFVGFLLEQGSIVRINKPRQFYILDFDLSFCRRKMEIFC